MKLLTPFALVRHVGHTPVDPMFALHSPRGFVTQPLEQFVSGDWPTTPLESELFTSPGVVRLSSVALESVYCTIIFWSLSCCVARVVRSLFRQCVIEHVRPRASCLHAFIENSTSRSTCTSRSNYHVNWTGEKDIGNGGVCCKGTPN